VAEMPGEAVRRSDNRRLRAQGLYVLGRGRGAQAPPLSLHPIPRSLALTERRKYPAETQPFGAALVQAHLALETNFGCGLTSHWNQSSFPGSFTDWKMLTAEARELSSRWINLSMIGIQSDSNTQPVSASHSRSGRTS